MNTNLRKLIVVAFISALLSALLTLSIASRYLPDACLESPSDPEVELNAGCYPMLSPWRAQRLKR